MLKMDRVRRISEEIIQKFPGLFGSDYQANKEALDRVVIVQSKMLRNKIAGYITKVNINAAAAAAAAAAESQPAVVQKTE